jgi:hypothetical protein
MVEGAISLTEFWEKFNYAIENIYKSWQEVMVT